MLVEMRTRTRIDAAKLGQLGQFLGAGAGQLRLDGNTMYTMRATASVRLPNGQLSEVRRTAAAQVKYLPAGYDTWMHVLRWYDTTWSN